MFNILPRLEQEFPWLHTRSGNESDFHEITQRKGINVIFRNDFPKGVWVYAAGQHFILLNSSLRGWDLLYTMYHELGHCLFHIPTQSVNFEVEWCDPGIRRKQHLEAEQIAALILLPWPELEFIYQTGADQEYTELAELVKVREEIMKSCGK